MSTDAQPMNKEAEDRLLGAVKEAVAWVEDGVDPTEAVIKTARALDLNPEMTTLLVHAYNTGRMTYQREKCSGNVLCKMAEFPVARLEDVLKALWPPEPKKAAKKASVDLSCYDRPPTIEPRSEVRLREKVAAAPLPRLPQSSKMPVGDESIKMSKAWGKIERLRKKADDARYRAKLARDRYLAAMGKLADYFKTAHPRASFAEVEYNAQLLFGEPAKHAMDYVYLRNRMREKRAGNQPPPARPIDPAAPPYSLVREAIERGREVLACQREHQRVVKEAQSEFKETLRPFAPGKNTSPPSSSGPASGSFLEGRRFFSKRAGLFSSVLTGSTAAMVGGLARGAKPPSKTDLMQDAAIELSDAEHENELRKIEAQTMLQDLLTNDEVLSSYDPDEVLQAYNEIVALSPRLATQPAVIRPMLRKRMTQGAYEPFDVQQLADIEKAVATAETPSGAVPSHPISVLEARS